MKQFRKSILLVISLTMLVCAVPIETYAAEVELQTEIVEVKESNGKIVALYDTKGGEAPEQIYYAIFENGQPVWDGIQDVESGSGEQECVLDIPTQSIEWGTYDIAIWGASDLDGNEVVSQTYAFKINMGGGQDSASVPTPGQPRTMIVNAPFAYIGTNKSIDSPICYLENGDTVQVYGNPDEEAVVYVTKDDVSGYMYSGCLASKVFSTSGTGNDAIVQIALTQLGNAGGQPYWSWYGYNSRVAWCACFVSWCANECGYIEQGIIPKFSACDAGMAWFNERGQWENRDCAPQPGYIIFFDWDNSGNSDHVGIVEKCENGIVYTVEGNSSDACNKRSYPVGSSVIRGYGVPAY